MERDGFLGIRGLVTVGMLVCLAVVGLSAPSALAANQHSAKVAIILGEGSSSAGELQISGSVAGDPEDSFEAFSFDYLDESEIEADTLAQYDTVVLNQVFTSSLSAEQQATLSSFITAGGKLIIHDADGTEGNDYSWLPVPASTGQSCENCGNTGGIAEIKENNSLVSSDPSSPYYVDVSELPDNSDAVGDANGLLTTDPRWDDDIRATNEQNVNVAVDAYASDGGLIIYNGFDTDDIAEVFPSGTAWLQKLWYNELNQQWDPDNLPHSNPVVGSGGHCGEKQLKVGVVTVCAESITGSGEQTQASGNVVLDGGIGVGNGPLEINQETKQLTTAGSVSLTLLRGSSPLSLGSAAFSIEASGTTDPISGKGGLAKVALTGANLGALGSLKVGNLPFSLPLTGNLTMYLDNELDGGLIGAGTVQLPMVGKLQTSAALSLGFYANSPAPVVALGGGVQFGAVELGAGWKFDGLTLSYQEPTDTWTAAGGLQAPIGSLQASGSLVHGQINALAVNIGGQEVPLGDTGFFFTEFGGGISGLVTPPIKISARTAGFWGEPKLPVKPFFLKNLAVTVSLGGSISLDGNVSFVFKEHSPINGQIHLQLNLSPFSAIGSVAAEGSLPGISIKLSGNAGFTTSHFTASEQGKLKVFLLSGDGKAVISDAGMGASGSLCTPKVLGFGICETLAFAGSWHDYATLNVPELIGGDPQKLITVPGISKAGGGTPIHVGAGRTFLFLAVSGSQGAPAIRLRAPDGTVYGAGSHGRVLISSQSQFGLTLITVIRPEAGTWRLSGAPGEHALLHVHAQTAHRIRLIAAAAVTPRGSARHPLSAKRQVTLRWSSGGLPAGVRVVIVRRSLAHQQGPGVTVASRLGANGHYVLSARKLLVGRNYFTLVATRKGVPFQEAAFPGVVWRAAPPHKRKAKRPSGHH